MKELLASPARFALLLLLIIGMICAIIPSAAASSILPDHSEEEHGESSVTDEAAGGKGEHAAPTAYAELPWPIAALLCTGAAIALIVAVFCFLPRKARRRGQDGEQQ